MEAEKNHPKPGNAELSGDKHQDQGENGEGNSIEMKYASQLVRDLLENNVEEDLKGYKDCIEIMEKENYAERKPGRIIAMVRSLEYAAMVDGGKGSHLPGKAKALAAPAARFEAKRQLKKKGQAPRDFAYVHMAIYVGKLRDKHYVIENAGLPIGKEGKGPWLQLRDIKTAFGDLKFQDSHFKIIKPAKSHDSAQRAMAAYFLKFEYKFNIHAFNCESFTNVCAENFSKGKDEKERNPPMQRVLAERTDWDKIHKKRPGARERSQKEQREYMQRLAELISSMQTDVDRHNFELFWNDKIEQGEEVGPDIRKKRGVD